MSEIKIGNRIQIGIRVLERRPAEAAADRAGRDLLRRNPLVNEVILELVDFLADAIKRTLRLRIEFLHRHVLRRRVAHQRRQRQHDFAILG